MGRNAELLRAVGDHIAAHPHLYDQGSWAKQADCGTYGCVAGHAVDLADGYALDFTYGGGCGAVTPEGHRVGTEVAAMRALGVDGTDATQLFAGSWRPTGWYLSDSDEHTACLVRDALYALADGARIKDVSLPPP